MCGRRVLRKDSPAFVELKGLSCNQWACGECAPGKRARVRAQALAGEAEKMLTLTVPGKDGESRQQHADRLVVAWALLLKRMRRRNPGRRVEYFWAIEKTKLGEPHMHVLLRCDFIPWQWLRAQWVELMGAHAIDIRQINGTKQRALYVTKYIGKDPEQFGRHKRYSMSKGWILNKGTPEQEATRWKQDGWEIVEQSFADAAQGYVSQGYRPDCSWDGITKFWRPGRSPACSTGPPQGGG
jgi:hypothetical protein